MALDPKPIIVTGIAVEDYEGAGDPQPFVLVGGIASVLDLIDGFDAGAVQTLKNDEGDFVWVDDA